jgi:hypothetical protein
MDDINMGLGPLAGCDSCFSFFVLACISARWITFQDTPRSFTWGGKTAISNRRDLELAARLPAVTRSQRGLLCLPSRLRSDDCLRVLRRFKAYDRRLARFRRKDGGLVIRLSEVPVARAECRDDEHRHDNDAEENIVPAFVSTVPFHRETPLKVDCTRKSPEAFDAIRASGTARSDQGPAAPLGLAFIAVRPHAPIGADDVRADRL